jgi:hypothetical protein
VYGDGVTGVVGGLRHCGRGGFTRGRGRAFETSQRAWSRFCFF